jgi:HlyD family secretion protein
VQLGNVEAIEIVADFLTPDAMSVTPGARATIREWGGSEPLAARVRQVDSGAFTKVSALGLEEQRVPIVLDLAGEPRRPLATISTSMWQSWSGPAETCSRFRQPRSFV